MGAIPIPRTWVDKEIPPYSTFNAEVFQTVSWLLQPPMCRLRQTAAQNIPTAASTAVTWDKEDTDPFNWHGTTNPTRVTPTFPGWYRGWYSIGFNAMNEGTRRDAYVRQSGSIGRARRDNKPPTSASTWKSVRGVPFFLSMNGTTDYFEVLVYHDIGYDMGLQSTPPLDTEVFCRWWAPL